MPCCWSREAGLSSLLRRLGQGKVVAAGSCRAGLPTPPATPAKPAHRQPLNKLDKPPHYLPLGERSFFRKWPVDQPLLELTVWHKSLLKMAADRWDKSSHEFSAVCKTSISDSPAVSNTGGPPPLQPPSPSLARLASHGWRGRPAPLANGHL